MSSIVAQFDPSLASAEMFTAPNSAVNGVLVFFNESNIGLDLAFADGSSMYLPAWYHRHKCGATGSVNINWTVNNTLTSSNPPISQVIVEAYAVGEHYPADGPLVRQTNVGNSVTTSVGSTTAVKNDGMAPLTSIIEATPSDAGSSTWNADNSGNLTVKGDNAGVLTTLIQLIAGASPAVKLAAATVLTEALGNMKVDGTLAVTGASTFTGDATFNGASTGLAVTNNATIGGTLVTTGDATFNGSGNGVSVTNNLQVVGTTSLDNGAITTSGAGTITTTTSIKVNANVDLGNNASVYKPALFIDSGNNLCLQSEAGGTNINLQDATGAVIGTFVLANSSAASVDAGGSLTVSKLFMSAGSISRISSFLASVTTTPTAFNHGLGGTPTLVLMSLSGSAGSPPANQCYYSNVTSTQVTLVAAAGVTVRVTCIAL